MPLSAQDDETTPGPDLDTPTSNSAVVTITKGRQIEGELSNLNEISVNTNFGAATFPLSDIDGIKLHADEKDSCVFAFKNGDLVTGHLQIDKLTINTDWGDANINVASVETIRMNTKGEFYQDTSVAGKPRWRFGETREVTRQQQQQQPAGTQNPAIRRGQPGQFRINNSGR